MTRQTLTTVDRDFHERMHAAHIYGLWELAGAMTRHPEPKAIPYMWKSSLLEAIVRESGEVVPVGEERRALQLFNPGLDGRWATTNTMIAAVQLLLPGEVARAHRHTPTAIRFIMEGEGAYTAVDGERVYMAPGEVWWFNHQVKHSVLNKGSARVHLIMDLAAPGFTGALKRILVPA